MFFLKLIIRFIKSYSWFYNNVSKLPQTIMMSSEKEPYECPRFVLFSLTLSIIGPIALHILADTNVVSNETLKARLIRIMDEPAYYL